MSTEHRSGALVSRAGRRGARGHPAYFADMHESQALGIRMALPTTQLLDGVLDNGSRRGGRRPRAARTPAMASSPRPSLPVQHQDTAVRSMSVSKSGPYSAQFERMSRLPRQSASPSPNLSPNVPPPASCRAVG